MNRSIKFQRGLGFSCALVVACGVGAQDSINIRSRERQRVAARDAQWTFKDKLGIQLYSLRAQAKHNPLAALDLVMKYGVDEVETAGTGDLPPDHYASALRERGLKAVSAHMSYDRMKKDLAGVIAEAKTLGVRYIVVPSLAHKDGVFDAESVAADFNRWGAALREAGLAFGYHPHGFEFRPLPNGRTRFDTLVRRTDPQNVCFEMDVFWVAHAGVDPVALLRRYADRWRLMHVKDLRKGAVTGTHTGSAPVEDKVAVGTGQIDWPAVLRAAQEVGVAHYLLEDESATPLETIPASLSYLRGLE